jgi:23S rRNA (guanine745-N1)-methyltransferase
VQPEFHRPEFDCPVFRCPVCSGELAEAPTLYSCVRGHSFDRARDGSVNLLRTGRLAGGAAGDDAAMVAARRAVFDAGLYAPVIDAVVAAVATIEPRFVLDAGCGEGAYLAAATERSGAMGWGIDISKAAIKLAARRHRAGRFAIASTYSLPFADGVFDAVINVFSPRDFAEMGRVLRAGGIAVVATPGPDHLHQFKAALYDDPRPHAQDVVGDSPVTVDLTRVRFELDLVTREMRQMLLQMTPYWWSSTPERRELVLEIDQVDVDVLVAVHRGGVEPRSRL